MLKSIPIKYLFNALFLGAFFLCIFFLTFTAFRVIYVTTKNGGNFMFGISERRLNALKERYPEDLRLNLLE